MTYTDVGDDAVVGPVRQPLGFVEVALVFGLPLFVALAAVLTWWSVNQIEGGLEAQLSDDLAAAGIDPEEVDIEVRYRDATISGTLPAATAALAEEALIATGLLRSLDVGALREAPPKLTLASDSEGRELATGPVEIEVVNDGMTLTVAGTVLNEGQHNVVLETVDLLTGRAEIDERLTISRLAPEVEGVDARIADLVTAMGSMSLADEWSIRLTDRGLTIEAVVADAEAAAAVGALDRILTSTSTTIEVTGLQTVDET